MYILCKTSKIVLSTKIAARIDPTSFLNLYIYRFIICACITFHNVSTRLFSFFTYKYSLKNGTESVIE